MANQNKFYFRKILSIKKNNILLCIYFNYILFLKYLCTSGEEKINLVIKGKGQSYFLNSSFYLEPKEVIINGETKTNVKKIFNFEKDYNNVTIIYEDKLNSCENMFNGITNITEIDLTEFDTSEVTNMDFMFNQSINLEKITFGNINTSKVESMSWLFQNCIRLKSINISNFDTSSVKNMDGIFRYMETITSIDVSKFNTQNVENMFDMFGYCYKLTSINVSNFNTSKVTNMQGMFFHDYELKYVDLSNFDTRNVINMRYMFEKNYKLKRLELSNFDTSLVIDVRSMFKGNSELIYLNLYSFTLREETNNYSIFDSIYPNIKICINDSYTKNILKQYNKFFNCSDICFKENIKIDLKYNICIENCNESEFKYEYNNYCYEKCPEETYNIENEYLCLNQKPEGYYLDYHNNIYKKCYETCRDCYIQGNITNNNCIECKTNYLFLNGSILDFLYELNIGRYKNCYIECPYYFYKNESSSIYYCTENETCPNEYSYLIYEKKECINKCDKEEYIYEYQKRCYKECPENTTTKENFCKPKCKGEYPFVNILQQECVKYCPIKDIIEKKCIQNYKSTKQEEKENNIINTEVMDLVLQNIENDFMSENYDTSILDKGEDEILEIGIMTITLTTTKNQKYNINNNVTIIDLGECESLLRKENNISDNETLYMKKIDIIQEKMKIPKVEYNVYSKSYDKNLKRLNLSVCENSEIFISIPIKLTENLDQLNSSSGYYNDICYIAKSDSGTDISLTDRKKEFIEKNKTVCQDDCIFEEYDKINEKAKCSCKAKESKLLFTDMKIDRVKLYNNFIDIKNIANIKLIVCYKELFTQNGIKYNIASYSIISIILFHIIVIIFFYYKLKIDLDNKIKDIIFSIKNWYLVRADRKLKKQIKLKNETEIKDENINNENSQKSKNLNLNNQNPLEENKGIINIKEKNNTKDNNNYIYNFMKTRKNSKNSNEKILSENINKNEIIKKSKEIMMNNDKEINNLNYKKALKYDKRSYCEYYFSLLKTKHIILFSFYNNKDYNSKIIKIDLFFINFVIFFAINALFFNDNTMHKIYEDQGSFNFIYQLPQVIYSSLISTVLNKILEILALSETNILEFKKNKKKKNLEKRIDILNNKLHIKFILYFIISSILLFLFWYYLSMFCAIYRNTQYHLIKDTLISFSLSLIYPFGIYLLPGIFRIPALSNKKFKREFLYKISQFFQML